MTRPEKVTFYDYEPQPQTYDSRYLPFHPEHIFQPQIHPTQNYFAASSPSPPRYKTLSGYKTNSRSQRQQNYQNFPNIYLPPKNPLAKPLKTKQNRRKKSSIAIKYETTWYTSVPVITGLVVVVLMLISLKADSNSPWIWQQLNYFFTFLIDTILIPVKLAGWELLVAFVNVIALGLILFRVKQFKSEIDKLSENEEILQEHIEWLDENMTDK